MRQASDDLCRAGSAAWTHRAAPADEGGVCRDASDPEGETILRARVRVMVRVMVGVMGLVTIMISAR